MYMKGEKFFKNPDTKPEDRILTVMGEEGLKNVGLQKHLYNPGVEGITSDDLEEIFRKYGEDFYDATIREIENLPIGSEIPQSIKDRLCLMLAAMRVRTPFFKQEIEQIDETMSKHFMARKMENSTAEEIVEEFKQIKGEKISLGTAGKIRKLFLESKYELNYPNGLFIKMALTFLEMHADIFHQMTWNIYRTEERCFTTSDNPLVYFVPKEHINAYVSPKSLTARHSEVFFSLTKNQGLHLTWRKETQTINRGSREIVDTFNFNIPLHSLDYLFSPIEMNALKKFVETHIPYPFRFSIS